jgi:hypothetical protein
VKLNNRQNSPEIIKANKITKEVVYTYRFNKNGIKDSSVLGTVYFDSLGGTLIEKMEKDKYPINCINTYYANGRLRTTVRNGHDASSFTTYFEYDSYGNEIYNYEFNKDTTFLTVKHRIYDEKNRKIALELKTGNEPFYTTRKYYYDEKNNLSKIESYGRDGKMIYSYSFEYSADGRDKIIYLDGSERKRKVAEYVFNADSQCVKEEEIEEYSTSLNPNSSSKGFQNTAWETTYNSDKTIQELDIYYEGKKTKIFRHFYFH